MRSSSGLLFVFLILVFIGLLRDERDPNDFRSSEVIAEQAPGFFVAPSLPPNQVDCQELVVTTWMVLAPDESWTETLAMQGCAANKRYTFYGHISRPNQSPLIKPADKLDFEMVDTGSGITYQADARITEFLPIPQSLELSVTNTGKKDVRVRFSFVEVLP
jgi:hypothetical protein